MIISKNLENLKIEITLMARKAEAIFEKAVALIGHPDEKIIQEIRQMDKSIDESEILIDNLCIDLLLKDPYAIDFRYVFSAIKTIKELERVGDQSKTVAKWTPRMMEAPNADMQSLILKTREALNTAVNALIHESMSDAHKVMELEFLVDEIEDRIIESTTDVAEAFIAKALERIGDLATNVCENVIFSLDATDIRHGGYERK